jgi:hypothetical protein
MDRHRHRVNAPSRSKVARMMSKHGEMKSRIPLALRRWDGCLCRGARVLRRQGHAAAGQCHPLVADGRLQCRPRRVP